MSEKITCTVKRSTWARGGHNGPIMVPSRLLNSYGNMCCLGFLGETCGIPKATLMGVALPMDLSDENYLQYPKLDGDDSWGAFATLNDTADVKSEEDREEKLAALAEKNGFTFVFVD